MSGARDLDADLNDELLALAGDDSDEEEEYEEVEEVEEESEDEGAVQEQSPSPSPPRPSIEKPTPVSPPTKATPASTSKVTSNPIPEDDGSQPGSPQSLGSDAMDESDAESDAVYSDGDYNNGTTEFPLEGIYVDANEKRALGKLSELDREAILEERRRVRDEKEQAAKLRALIQSKDNQAVAKKRKAAAADLNESPPKSRAKDKRADALADLKRARENRDTARRLPSARKSRRSRSRSTGSSQGDADGDSDEVEFAEDPVRAAPKISPDASLEEIERLRLGRSRFQQYCFYPVFERYTTDAFARVQVANGVYKMGQIRSYTTGKPYAMEQPNGRQIMNDQYAEIATGESGNTTKPWPLTHCSNSRFESREYEEYKAALRDGGKRIPNQLWAQKKCQELHNLVSYQLSSEEINAKIQKQNRLAHLLAQKAGNANKVMPTNEHQRKQQAIAERNMNTKLENNRNVREALLAKRAKERAATRAAAAAAAEREAAAKAAATLAAPVAEKDDLFGSDISRTGTPTPGGTATPDKAVRKGMPTFTRRKMDDEIISQMDFGIELDI